MTDPSATQGAIHGAVHWNELNSWDVEAAKARYGAAFGWRFEPMPLPDGRTYWLAKRGDALTAGVFPLFSPAYDDVPEHWLTYFAVDDPDAAAAVFADDGGAVLRAPFDVPGIGRMAVVRDAKGAVLALMKPAPQAGG